MIILGGRKLFEEIDKPTRMKILSEKAETIEIEAGWTGDLKGFNGFPDGKMVGSGSSVPKQKWCYNIALGRIFLPQMMDMNYYSMVVI